MIQSEPSPNHWPETHCHVLQWINFLQSLDLRTIDNRIWKLKWTVKGAGSSSKPACIDNALCIHATTQTQKPAQPNKVDQINAANTPFVNLNHTKKLEYILWKMCCGEAKNFDLSHLGHHFFLIKFIKWCFDQYCNVLGNWSGNVGYNIFFSCTEKTKIGNRNLHNHTQHIVLCM